MTIERDPPWYWAFRCDHCDEAGTVSIQIADDFYAVVDHIKKLGWKVIKTGAGWLHLCDECKAISEFDDDD